MEAEPARPSRRRQPSQAGLPPCPPAPARHYKNPAHQRRVRGAWAAAGDCDLLLFLVDAARELQRADPRIARLLADSASQQGLGMPADWDPPQAVLVLNKASRLGGAGDNCACWARRAARGRPASPPRCPLEGRPPALAGK